MSIARMLIEKVEETEAAKSLNAFFLPNRLIASLPFDNYDSMIPRADLRTRFSHHTSLTRESIGVE